MADSKDPRPNVTAQIEQHRSSFANPAGPLLTVNGVIYVLYSLTALSGGLFAASQDATGGLIMLLLGIVAMILGNVPVFDRPAYTGTMLWFATVTFVLFVSAFVSFRDPATYGNGLYAMAAFCLAAPIPVQLLKK